MRWGKLFAWTGAVAVLLSFILSVVILFKETEPDSDHSADTAQMHMIMTLADAFDNNGMSVPAEYVPCRSDSHTIGKEVSDTVACRCYLVCRFSEDDCESCVDYAIEKILQLKSQTKIPMLFWGNYQSAATLRAIAVRFGIDPSEMAQNVPALDIPIESHGYPYYMVLHENAMVTDVFTPDRMDAALTDFYFNHILEKLGRK